MRHSGGHVVFKFIALAREGRRVCLGLVERKNDVLLMRKRWGMS